MKVLLVAPKVVLTGYSRLFLETDEIGLGLLFLDAVCRKQGHDTKIVLTSAAEIPSVLQEFTPDVAGITSLTPTYSEAVRIGQQLKQENPRIITVFGGHHVSALPEETLAQEAVDYVVRGEGDEAFPLLLDELAKGNRTPDIPGVCYTIDGKPV